jgi:prepilin-type N-terminal cleavage/methylation domain-containing protein
MKPTTNQGFTLIEILISIGLLAALAGIVLVAVNPARQFAQMRNTQRSSDVNGILNAIGQRAVENKGLFNCPSITIPTDTAVTATAGANIGSGSGNLDLRSCLVPSFISELPVDPSNGAAWNGTTYNTGYRIFQDANGRITIFAPTTEPTVGNSIISLTR